MKLVSKANGFSVFALILKHAENRLIIPLYLFSTVRHATSPKANFLFFRQENRCS